MNLKIWKQTFLPSIETFFVLGKFTNILAKIMLDIVFYKIITLYNKILKLVNFMRTVDHNLEI